MIRNQFFIIVSIILFYFYVYHAEELLNQLELKLLQSITHESYGENFDFGPEPSFIYYNLSYDINFKDCNTPSRTGPKKFTCDKDYKNKLLFTSLIKEGKFSGVQIWTVPETSRYSIVAIGASGGSNFQKMENKLGTYLRAEFYLEKDEKIYIMMGNEGMSYCKLLDNVDSKNSYCGYTVFNTSIQDLNTKLNGNKTDSFINAAYYKGGGAGGGGGATFVFKVITANNTVIPLLVANGAGGRGALNNHDNNDITPVGTEFSTDSNSSSTIGKGRGGSLYSRKTKKQSANMNSSQPDSLRIESFMSSSNLNLAQEGGSLIDEGGLGGSTCLLSKNWISNGGFGGGGAGCNAGGGGGGFIGGNYNIEDNPYVDGEDGISFVNKMGIRPKIKRGIHRGNGIVRISLTFDCPCKKICILLRWQPMAYHCACHSNEILSADSITCLHRTDRMGEGMSSYGKIWFGFGIAFIILCTILLLLFYLKRKNVFKLFRSASTGNRLNVNALRSHENFQLNNLETLFGNRCPSTSTCRPLIYESKFKVKVTQMNPTYSNEDNTQLPICLNEIKRKRLRFLRPLGRGAFGEVYEGYLTATINNKEEGIKVAAKVMPRLSSKQAELDFELEAQILSQFNHTNIVRLLGVCFKSKPHIIVLELLEGGDLRSYLRKKRSIQNYSNEIVDVSLINHSIDVANGCKFLEQHRFIHRDIAARNCLVTCDTSRVIVKIADFGMARDIYSGDYYRKKGKTMLPIKWMPPEAILDGIFTGKTDVWSYGVLLWEIYTYGYMPYPGKENHEVIEFISKGGRLEKPTNCQDNIYCLMCNCWAEIGDNRPNFTQISEELNLIMEQKIACYYPQSRDYNEVQYSHDTLSNHTESSYV